MPAAVAFRALPGLPEVEPGADLPRLIREALQAAALELQPRDVLVVAQKIVSKAEGRQRRLAEVSPSSAAIELAATVRKDPRFVELVLEESSAVVRAVPDILITRHRSGFVMANAGIDRSNLPNAEDTVLLLPLDCDASAQALRAAFAPLEIGVIISDSFGRPWRQGTVNVALGVAGFPAMLDRRGTTDRHGRVMQTTHIALADAVAAGAGLVMGETIEGTPVVHVRGLDFSAPLADGQSLVRAVSEDLFR
ncbi:MAG: coenzyme F420-0:L-glutamate ligase [Gammaproteobacteria bacterium]|nr:coenzyme F420-0:L-glutamate ligase [Gammaproteobacteria bacterium]